MKEEGYISNFADTEKSKGIKEIEIELKYAEGKPVIKKIERISKPGRRVYSNISELPKVFNGLGLSILSTSKGVMPDYKARLENVGGEILCNVF